MAVAADLGTKDVSSVLIILIVDPFEDATGTIDVFSNNEISYLISNIHS